MTDVHELLRMKEDDLARVRKEIDALRIVAPLVSEPNGSQGLEPDPDSEAMSFGSDDFDANENSVEETSSEPAEMALHPIAPKRSRLRDWFGRAAGE